MPKPPIVILTAFYKPFSSGAELCVEQMVKYRAERDLVIITSRLDKKLPRLDKDSDVEIIRVGFGSKFDKFLYPFFCVLPALRLHPKIVHAVMESYAGIGLVIIKTLRPKLKTVLTLQSGNLDVDSKLQKWPLSWIWKKIHTVPDKITAISNFLADRAIKFRNNGNDVIVVPNGVDMSVARLVPKQQVPGRIVCISRLSHEKGVDVLIKAFAKVLQNTPTAELHIVGDGQDRGEVEELIKQFNLQDKVKLYGRLPHDQAIRIIATGQVFALLSRGEGQGIVLLEAASAGLPSVATDVGGIPEAVINGETGYLVPNEDYEAAAVRLAELLQDDDLRQHMGDRAVKYAANFEWSECVEKYQELWSELSVTQVGHSDRSGGIPLQRDPSTNARDDKKV